MYQTEICITFTHSGTLHRTETSLELVPSPTHPETRVTFDAFDVIPAIQTIRASLHDYYTRTFLIRHKVSISGSNSDRHQTRRLTPIRPDERVDSHHVVSTCSFSARSRPTSSPIPDSEPRTRPTYDVGPFITHASRSSSIVPEHRQARIHPQ